MVKDYLAEFVRLQKGLVAAIRNARDIAEDEWLIELPREGEVHFDRAVWNFGKHGSGLVFTHEKTRVKIDVTELSVSASWFDEWRLRTYLGSLGNKGSKFILSVTKRKNQTLEDGISEWFSFLLKDGVIEKTKGGYYVLCDMK